MGTVPIYQALEKVGPGLTSPRWRQVDGVAEDLTWEAQNHIANELHTLMTYLYIYTDLYISPLFKAIGQYGIEGYI